MDDPGTGSTAGEATGGGSESIGGTASLHGDLVTPAAVPGDDTISVQSALTV